MWFKKAKSPVPLKVGFFNLDKAELDRMSEALKNRNLTALDVISIETNGEVITVWHRSGFTTDV